MDIKKEVKELRKIVHQQSIEIVQLREENKNLKEKVDELEGKQK